MEQCKCTIVADWQDLLSRDLTKKDKGVIQSHERTGRPLGGRGFLDRLKKMTNRILVKQKPGPKKIVKYCVPGMFKSAFDLFQPLGKLFFLFISGPLPALL